MALSLLPIGGAVDGIRLNVKLSLQLLYQCLYSFYLEVGWASGFAVCYDTDADSLSVDIPGSTRYD